MIGIYAIKNKITNKMYIGQAINIQKRFISHKKSLIKKMHHSIKLQNSWNKYGEENFEFLIIEKCLIDELNSREIYWINHYNSHNKGYNCTKGGNGTYGYKFTNEQLKKLSKSHKGQIPINKGQPRSEETKKRISEKCKGLKLSNETKQKIREANIGKKLSEDHKQKISNSNKGLKRSEESKQKMSKSFKGRIVSEETKQKLKKSNSGKNNGFYGKTHSSEIKETLKQKSKGNKNASGKRSEEVKIRMRQMAAERKKLKE